MGRRFTGETGVWSARDEWRGGLSLWRARGFQQGVRFALDASEFLAQLAPKWPRKVEKDPAEFREREQTEALTIGHRYHFHTGGEELPVAFPNTASLGSRLRAGKPSHRRALKTKLK
jgi:hypothetical protein